MSDATDNNGKAGPDGDGPGVSLRRAREARGMGVKDIAQDLHLDPWIIEALEADDFEALGAPVFAKGHLRQYGSLLGLATDDLMIAYYRVRGRLDAPPPPITSTMTRPETNRRAVWAALLLAVLVLGALVVLLWFLSDENSGDLSRSNDRASSAALAEPIDSVPPSIGAVSTAEAAIGQEDEPVAAAADAPDEQDEPPAMATTTSGANTPAPATAPAPAAVRPVVAAPAADRVTLQLVFNGESWVEVYDRDGARLIYGMYGAGRSRTVSGMPPIEVYLGRSRDVSVSINGRAYPIPSQSIRGNTARFVIEDDSR